MDTDSGTQAQSKDQNVFVRLDLYEREELQKMADGRGLSLSRMVAQLIREATNGDK